MKLFGMPTKLCAVLLFCMGLIVSGLLAWRIGEAEALTTIWVAREKIMGAEANIPLQQVDVGRGLLFGVPAFLVGGLISAIVSELYYAALRFFRNET